MTGLRWACACIAMLLALQIAPTDVALAAGAEEEIREKLQQTVSLEFECEPLRNVLKFIAEFSEIDFQVDMNKLKKLAKKKCQGRNMRRKAVYVTVNVKDVTLESALNKILSKHGLRFYVKGESIFVSGGKKKR